MNALRENDLGQVLILAVNELRWDPALERLLQSLRPGGILIDAPLAGAAQRGAEFLSKAAGAVAALPLLAIREEGGDMDPLRALLPSLPSPRSVAEKGLAAVRRLGDLVGSALHLFGFNTDLAPLLDLAMPDPGRVFSSEPAQMAKLGTAWLEGLEPHGVLACGKHFPGLAGARRSGHPERLLVPKPMAELWREDLLPFRALLPRLPLLLLSTAAYKAYDFDWLQSAGLSSKIVEGLLRVKLGYKGVAIACGLESENVRGALRVEEAAVQALRAECDMLLVEDAGVAERMRRALSAALESGKLPSARLEQALKRIRFAKRELKPPLGSVPRRSMERLAKEFMDFSRQLA